MNKETITRKLESIREKRQARLDDGWVTMNGTHVEIGSGGAVTKGPKSLVAWAESKGGITKGFYNMPKEVSSMTCKNHEELKNHFAKTYNIDIADSISKIKYENVQKACSGLEDAIKEYPILKDQIDKIDTYNKGVMCTSGHTIYMNKNYFNKEDFQKVCDTQSENGFWPKNTTIQSVAYHEAGHCLEKYIGEKSGNYLEAYNAWKKGTYAKAIISESCKEVKKTPYGKKKKNSELKASLSGYAAKNDQEALAEAHSDVYTNGKNANPLSIAIVNNTKKKLKEIA